MTMQTPHQPSSAAVESAASLLPSTESVPLREQLSALVDNECDMLDWAALHSAYAESAELKRAWADYHLIGDVLRAQAAVPCANRAAFAAGVMARVAQETQRPSAVAAQPVATSVPVAAPTPVAANDDVFRWKMVAGLASFAAVAAVVWQLVATPAMPTGPQLASAPAPSASDALQLVVTPAGNVMIRDAQLDELIAAHRQWGGVSALQMPVGFLRSATYEPSQR